MTIKDPNQIDLEDDTPKTEAVKQKPEVKPEPPFVIEDKPAYIPTLEELTTPPPEAVVLPDPEAPHGRNKDGTPTKKRGRKVPGDEGYTGDLFDRLDSVTQSTAMPQTRQTTVSPAAIAANYRQLGETAANLWFNVPQILLGADWAPEASEIPMVAKGFQDYFKAKGVTELDPTLSLTLILGTYTLARVNKPSVQTRLQSVMTWFRGRTPWFKKR